MDEIWGGILPNLDEPAQLIRGSEKEQKVQTEEPKPPVSTEEPQENPKPPESADEPSEDPSFSYRGYQVVRGEYFAHMNEPSVTLADYRITVNNACLKKAP